MRKYLNGSWSEAACHRHGHLDRRMAEHHAPAPTVAWATQLGAKDKRRRVKDLPAGIAGRSAMLLPAMTQAAECSVPAGGNLLEAA